MFSLPGRLLTFVVAGTGLLLAEATDSRSLALFGLAGAVYGTIVAFGLLGNWGNVWGVWSAEERRRVQAAPALLRRPVRFLRRDTEYTRLGQGILAAHLAPVFAVLGVLALLAVFS